MSIRKFSALAAALLIVMGFGCGGSSETAEVASSVLAPAEGVPSLEVGTVYVAGDVATVVDGLVAKDGTVLLAADDVLGALGAGALSLEDYASAGELIRTPEGFYCVPVAQGGATHGAFDEVFSPFAAGLAVGSPLTMSVEEQIVDGVTIDALYQSLTEEVGGSFVVLGRISIDALHATYLNRSAAEGVSLLSDASSFFASDTGAGWLPSENTAFLFGFVVDPDHPIAPENGGGLAKRIVYKNPMDASPHVGGSHTHVAVATENGVVVRHLLAQTTISDLDLDVYSVEKIELWPLAE